MTNTKFRNITRPISGAVVHCLLLVLVLACDKSTPVVSKSDDLSIAPKTESKPATSVEPKRTDLNKIDHGFPATVVMPDGLEIKVGWEKRNDDHGIPYGTSQATVQIGKETLMVNVVDKERADQIANYRQDKRWKVVLDEDGPDGSWAHAHEFGNGCSFSSFIPKGQIGCVVNAPCEVVGKLAALCLSIVHTGEAAPQKRQPDYGFGLGSAPDQAAYQVVSSIAQNNPDKLLEMWSKKGVKVYGRKVSHDKAMSAFKKRSVASYLKISCVPDVTGKKEEESCDWGAYGSAEGKIGDDNELFIFPHINGAQLQSLTMKLDAQGNWKLVRVELDEYDG